MGRTNETTRKIDKIVGEKILSRRLALGLSRPTLSKQLDVSHQQLEKYEKGTNRISPGRLVAIAKALNKPVQYFLEGVDQPVKPTPVHQRILLEISRNCAQVKSARQLDGINFLIKTLITNGGKNGNSTNIVK